MTDDDVQQGGHWAEDATDKEKRRENKAVNWFNLWKHEQQIKKTQHESQSSFFQVLNSKLHVCLSPMSLAENKIFQFNFMKLVNGRK